MIQLPIGSTLEQIKEAVKNNSDFIGKKHEFMVGPNAIISEIKYTWCGKVAKTAYLHILHVKSLSNTIVLTRWKEQKDGSFKTV